MIELSWNWFLGCIAAIVFSALFKLYCTDNQMKFNARWRFWCNFFSLWLVVSVSISRWILCLDSRFVHKDVLLARTIVNVFIWDHLVHLPLDFYFVRVSQRAATLSLTGFSYYEFIDFKFNIYSSLGGYLGTCCIVFLSRTVLCSIWKILFRNCCLSFLSFLV